MATATQIEIKRAQEAARQADILVEINERLVRIESMCERALELLTPKELLTAELVESSEFATKADIQQILELLANPQTVIDHPVTHANKRGRPSTQDK